jgi:hypothetical protein
LGVVFLLEKTEVDTKHERDKKQKGYKKDDFVEVGHMGLTNEK